MSSASVSPAGLGLEAGVTLRRQHLYFVAQFDEVLAVAIIRACDIAGYAIAVAAEQAMQWQSRNLANDVPTGDVDRRGDADECLPAPAFLVRQALTGQRQQLFMQSFGSQRIHIENLLGHASAQGLGYRLGRCVACRETESFDPIVGAHAHQNFVRLRNREVAYPVRAAGGGHAKNKDFEGNNSGGHVRLSSFRSGSTVSTSILERRRRTHNAEGAKHGSGSAEGSGMVT